MKILQLRVNDDPALKRQCKEVAVVDDNIRGLLQDMMFTLQATENGAALAANQVGIFWRLIVIDYFDNRLMLVNPRIISESGSQECIEGCLSFPDRFGKTIRPWEVTVQALTETGQEIVLTAKGEMAKCFCHEIDHLDGKVFIDKVIEWL